MAARPVAVSTGRPPCRYGTKCYRKNPEHLEQYSHPGRVMVATKIVVFFCLQNSVLYIYSTGRNLGSVN